MNGTSFRYNLGFLKYGVIRWAANEFKWWNKWPPYHVQICTARYYLNTPIKKGFKPGTIRYSSFQECGCHPISLNRKQGENASLRAGNVWPKISRYHMEHDECVNGFHFCLMTMPVFRNKSRPFEKYRWWFLYLQVQDQEDRLLSSKTCVSGVLKFVRHHLVDNLRRISTGYFKKA